MAAGESRPSFTGRSSTALWGTCGSQLPHVQNNLREYSCVKAWAVVKVLAFATLLAVLSLGVVRWRPARALGTVAGGFSHVAFATPAAQPRKLQAASSGCSVIEHGKSYFGDKQKTQPGVASAEDCCSYCANDDNCSAMTYMTDSDLCILKVWTDPTACPTPLPVPNAISGVKYNNGCFDPTTTTTATIAPPTSTSSTLTTSSAATSAPSLVTTTATTTPSGVAQVPNPLTPRPLPSQSNSATPPGAGPMTDTPGVTNDDVTSWVRPASASTPNSPDHLQDKGTMFDSLYWGLFTSLLLCFLGCLIAAMFVWKRKHKHSFFDDDSDDEHEGYEGLILPPAQHYWPFASNATVQQPQMQMLSRQPQTQLLPQQSPIQLRSQLQSESPPRSPRQRSSSELRSMPMVDYGYRQGAWPPPE